jgi:hypothetical protein
MVFPVRYNITNHVYQNTVSQAVTKKNVTVSQTVTKKNVTVSQAVTKKRGEQMNESNFN